MSPVVVLLVANLVLLVEVCTPQVDIAVAMFVFEQSVVAGVLTGNAGGLGHLRHSGPCPEEAWFAFPVAAAGPPLAVAVGECDAMYTGGGCGVALFVVALLGPESMLASQRLRRFIAISSIDQGRFGFRNLA